jgi:hypothetical protein
MVPGLPAGMIGAWSAYYESHALLSVTLRFLHMSAIVLGGGAGVWTDWQILKAAKSGTAEREAVLKLLSRSHMYVVPWMLVLVVTGALLTAADTRTFFVSKVFWVKIAMVALLVSNWVLLLILESRARQFGIKTVWSKLVLTSCLSALFWQTTLFAGTLLTVAA